MEIDTSKLTFSQMKLKLIKMMFDKSNIVSDIPDPFASTRHHSWRQGDSAKIPLNATQQQQEKKTIKKNSNN